MAGFIEVLLRCEVGELTYPLNTPLRSLNRSSGCGGRTVGCTGEVEAAVLIGVTEGTDVSDEELPHNSRTAGETGCDLSPP